MTWRCSLCCYPKFKALIIRITILYSGISQYMQKYTNFRTINKSVYKYKLCPLLYIINCGKRIHREQQTEQKMGCLGERQHWNKTLSQKRCFTPTKALYKKLIRDCLPGLPPTCKTETSFLVFSPLGSWLVLWLSLLFWEYLASQPELINEMKWNENDKWKYKSLVDSVNVTATFQASWWETATR